MKPGIQWSARRIGQVAEWASEEALAAVEGFFEGWTGTSAQPINLNSASDRQLQSLLGMTPQEAHRIIRARPYRDKAALLSKGVISENTYRRIKDRITVN
jgi:DNA uptake protein ComE-like DNA-binding protein